MLFNTIFISGGTYKDVKQALIQWIELYQEDCKKGLQFALYKNGNDEYVIVVNALDNERFAYLVNYMVYPENLPTNHNLKGFTTITSNEYGLKAESGTGVMLYIPEDDKEYTQTHVLSENGELKIYSFSGNHKSIDEIGIYEEPDIDFEALPEPEIITIASFGTIKEESDDEPSTFKRMYNQFMQNVVFRVEVIILFFFLTFLLLFIDEPEISFWVYCVFIGWVMGDYSIYRSVHASLILLGGTLLLCYLGYEITSGNFTVEEYGFMFFVPTVAVIVQFFCFRLFVSTVKREPSFDKVKQESADTIYFLAVGVISFVISAGIYKYIT